MTVGRSLFRPEPLHAMAGDQGDRAEKQEATPSMNQPEPTRTPVSVACVSVTTEAAAKPAMLT